MAARGAAAGGSMPSSRQARGRGHRRRRRAGRACPERASGAARADGPGTPPVRSAYRAAAGLRSRRRLVSHRGVGVRSSAVRPVRGRVSPCPSRSRVTLRRPSADAGRVRAAAADRQPGYPRTPDPVDGLVDKSAAGGDRRRRMARRSCPHARASSETVEPLPAPPRSPRAAPSPGGAPMRPPPRGPSGRWARPARGGPARTSSPTPSTLVTSRSPPIARARSRAIGRPRPVPSSRSWLGHPVESVEDPSAVLGADPGAFVADGDDADAARRSGR